MKVLMLERRHIIGGAAVSEEVFPGYTFSRASYVLSLLRNKVIEEIFPSDWKNELVLHTREYPSFTPTKADEYLLIGKDEHFDFDEISKFSRQDALKYKRYNEKLEDLLRVVNPIIDRCPSDKITDLLSLAISSKRLKESSISEAY